jgi:hypothetical protein
LCLLALAVAALLAHAGPAEAEVIIRHRVDEGPWLDSAGVYLVKGQEVLLAIDEVPGADVRWYRIIPDLSRNYQNANQPWEENPYQWTGYARIQYAREELEELRGCWVVDPFDVIGKVSPWDRILSWARGLSPRSLGANYEFTDVGSFWFQAEVELDGEVDRSPGIEESDERGLSPSVLRVSIRDGEGYLGYVSSFLNVPGLFGSTPYQSANYIGVDCADVLVAANRAWIGEPDTRDYNVAMLVDELAHVAEFEMANGNPSDRLEWGTHVKPGDLMAVRYGGWRQYGHIGALHSDSNRNGVLDRRDLVLHAGPSPLHFTDLGSGAFDGHVVVLRFPPSNR